jgi:VWFA-related protein
MARDRLFQTVLALVFLTAAMAGQQAGPPTAQPQQQQQTPPSVQPDRQMPPVTFKVEINYVEVDAVVTDQQGRFVRDLTKDDFEVLESGKPQQVTTFALVDIPVERAEKPLFAPKAIEPDVQTNQRRFDGRLYVLVLDDLHTNPLRSNLVKAAARRFIENSLGANDMAAVVTTGGRTDTAQDFTTNKRLLLAAVDKFMGQKLRSATLNKLDEYYRAQGTPAASDPITDPDLAERGYKARNTIGSLKNLADWMAGVRGRRKAVVLFSEGIDYDINNVFDNPDATTIIEDTREAIGAATRANVSIYTVDPRGLTNMGDELIEMGSPADDPSLRLNSTGLNDELRLSQDSLRVLADETGGFAVVNQNDFGSAFDRIVRDNSSYYVLGYYPTNDRRDGRFRTITVRLKRPGLQVRARKGYQAPRGKAPAVAAVDAKEGTSPELRSALESPIPVSGLTMFAFAAPFKGIAPNASVAVVVETSGGDFKFQEKGGKFDDTLEVSMIAVDQSGKMRDGAHQTFNMALRPETFRRVSQVGFRAISRLNLPPGKYQLRIAGRDTNGSLAGSVHYDLEVPDFTSGPLTMSGVVLSSARAGVVPTAKPDEELAKILPGPPTTAREFLTNDEIALVAEVYDNQGTTPHKVDITTTVLAEDGHTVFRHEEQRSSAELQGARGGYGYGARIPLKDIAPGLYVLKVEARSTLGRQQMVSREVQFSVRGVRP